MKYKLTDETKVYCGRLLYRIEALKSFANVKAGALGGWVESENNLSQDNDCWVYGSAKVCGEAKVYDNARVFDEAKVYDNVEVYGDAKVCGNATVFDNATVFGSAMVCGDAEVYDNAWVYGEAMVYDSATVCGEAEVYGRAKVYGEAEVYGRAKVYGEAEVVTKVTCKVFHVSLLRDNITVADSHCKIGCKTYTHKYWLDNIESIGKANNYSKAEINTYHAVLLGLFKQMQVQLKTR